MVKLQEIGDKPLLTQKIIQQKNPLIYNFIFTVPLTNPIDISRFGKSVEMLIEIGVFSKPFMWFNSLLEDQRQELPLDSNLKEAITFFSRWGENSDVKEWYINFRINNSYDYKQINFKSLQTSFPILATVKHVITEFLEENYKEISSLVFSANKKDSGRVALYTRFIKMIGDGLGFKTLKVDFSTDVLFVALDSEKIKLIRTGRLEERKRKFYEVGDQPLPIKRKDVEGLVTYTFTVPLKDPTDISRYNADSLDLMVSCLRFRQQIKSEEVSFWSIAFYTIPDESIKMQNFTDRSVPIKIMATVKSCVVDFIEKYRNDVDGISFTSYHLDKGRTILYKRFIDMLGTSLGFKTSIYKDGQDFVFEAIDPRIDTLINSSNHLIKGKKNEKTR